MDDQMNQNQGMPNVPGSMSPMDGGAGSMPPSSMGGGTPPPPPTMGGMAPEDPHEKILSALTRIEEKLAVIAVKVGA